MADTATTIITTTEKTPVPEPFSWSKWFGGFAKFVDWMKEFKTVLIVIAIILLIWFVWNKIFSKPQQNVNKPTVIVTPFAKVDKVDQTSTQISVTEKPWEVDLGMAVMRYDNKDGVIAGGMIKRKF